MNTKILFSDLDGTLLNAKKEITPASKAAIEEMISKGHKFMMATGRPIQSALKLAESFGFIQPGFYISSYNGALIYDCYEKKTIQKLAIPYEHVRFLLIRPIPSNSTAILIPEPMSYRKRIPKN